CSRHTNERVATTHRSSDAIACNSEEAFSANSPSLANEPMVTLDTNVPLKHIYPPLNRLSSNQ
ncbi:hypothetical protein CRM22_001509, partial [Opisthorchis felineus]